jgi:amidase
VQGPAIVAVAGRSTREQMKRREFVEAGVLGGAGALATASGRVAAEGRMEKVKAFDLEERTIADLTAAMASGAETARSIAEKYLARIEETDRRGTTLGSVIELNPDAIAIAEALDAERKSKGARGPLHGIPVLLKDNIDTADKMMTTAGSLALSGSRPAVDAFLVTRLREAGAVILGKTNLSEWANFRSTRSTSGWSGRGGQCRNPYALDRNPSGSSSGSGAAVAANLTAVAVGTETDGSIVSPAASCSIVGIKPTIGLVSRSGVVPIAHSQDTAGPMARTVADAAILLGAMTGIDARDRATQSSHGRGHADYLKFVDPNGLRGARIGVARQYVGSHERVNAVVETALDAMKAAGATLVDVKLPADSELGESEFTVLLYEFKADLNAYLAGLGAAAPAKSLAELIAFNEKNRDREMPYFGQEIFKMAEAKGPLTDKPYLDALAKNHRLTRVEGIDKAMDGEKLDALVAPTQGPPWLTDYVLGDHFTTGSTTIAAVAGYPSITVPAGYVFGLPIGISFFGRAYSEPVLIKIASGFEQTTKARKAPRFLETAEVTG